METVVNGKIAVSVYGFVHTNCTSDLECPPQTTCTTGASWAAFPAMCTCSLTVSRQGDECQDLTPGGRAMVFLLLVALFLAIVAGAVLGHDAYHMFKAKVKLNFSALQTTLLFLCVATMCMQIYLVLAIADQFIPFVLTKRGTGDVRLSSPTFVASNIFLAGTFFFETLGLLNISLVWVDIARASKSMSRRIQNNVQRFRVLLGVYYACFGGAVILFVILDRITLATYTVIPPIAFLLTTYVWGYFKMLEAAGAAASGSANSNEAGVKDAGAGSSQTREKVKNADLKRALRSMANTAFGLVLFGGLGVIFLIVQGSLQANNSNTPSVPSTIIINRFSWICWAACLCVGARYLHPLLMKNVGKERKKVVDSRTNDEPGMTALSSTPPEKASSMLTISQAPLGGEPSGAVAPTKKKSAYQNMPKDATEGLDVILKDDSSELRDKFTKFVRSKFASEALNLYDACKVYQSMALRGSSKAELAKLGNEIIADYVVEGAPRAVDMAHSLRIQLLDVAKRDAFDKDTFEDTRNMAFGLLKANFYHQFQRALAEEEEGAI